MNRIIILLFLCSISIFSAMADDVKLIKETQTNEKNTGYPRMPSRVWITCNAENGILTFAHSQFYVTLCVTVECEETGESWEGIITDGNMSMEYSTLSGTYSITCVNESDVTFVGGIYQ